MAIATVTNYNPTLKSVTVSGSIGSASLTSIVNQTRGRDLFVIGQTPIVSRAFDGTNTTFVFDTVTTGDSDTDVLVVRYQTGVATGLTNDELRASPIPIIEGLSIPTYDYMSLSYSGSNLSQVIYKVGGINGTTVATLNLSYDLNNNVTSITKV